MASSARIDELRKKFDENPRRYFAPLANEYRKSGDLEQAIFICQEYLPQQPGHMSGHIVYGQALYELSRFDEARAVFETALSLDPENLIALRHLGDIARQAGDTKGARVWYQRVLEADPRNEEIAQIMMTLLATPESSVPTVGAVPTLDSTTTLTMEPLRAPTPIQSSPAVEPPGAVSSFEPPPLPPPTSTWGEAPPAHEHDLLDLEDFSVGGVALSSLEAPPPEIDPIVPPTAGAHDENDTAEFETASIVDAMTPPATPVASADSGFDLGHEDGPFEDDPLAIAAAPEQTPADDAPIELASDIELGLVADGDSTTTFSETHGERVPDLETFGESVKGSEAVEPSSLEVETFFAGMAREIGPLSDASADEPVAEVVTPTPTPQFVEAVPSATFEMPEPVEELTPVAFEMPEPIEELPPVVFEMPEPVDEHAPVAFEMPEPVDEVPPAMLETPRFVDAVPEIPHVDAEPMLETPVHATPAYATPASVEAVTPAPIWTPPEQPAVPAEEFVTETMAELYLEQGHPESAVEIYHRLVAQRPDDEQLADRLRAVEATLRGESVGAAHDAMPDVAQPTGPTIREFLAGLLRLTPSSAQAAVAEPDAFASMDTPLSTPRVPTPVYDFEAIEPPRLATPAYDLDAIQPPAIPTPIYGLPAVDETAAYADESFVAEETSEPLIDLPVEEPLSESVDAMELVEPEPVARSTPAVPAAAVQTPANTPTVQIPAVRSKLVRGTPGSSETVSGSIDALFLGAAASSADTDAAAALSQAFAEDAPEPTPLQGVPAHAASSELSLDHVFKTTPARPREAENDGFSFDQFFADELADTSSKGGTEPPSTPGKGGGGAGDDIAQFNNWLNGLKKT